MGKKIDWKKLKELCADIYIARGLPETDAYILADNLISAELDGVHSHGITRMNMYMGYIDDGKVNMNGDIKILNEDGATLHVDANNCLGAVAATKAVKKGIDKAKKLGAAVVSVCNSNHFGVAAYYTKMMAEQGMVGIAMTNAFPHVAPFGSYEGYLGTNPISFGAPTATGKPVVLDMSTSIVARGKIAVAEEKEEQIPVGWAFDKNGNPTTDPKLALKGSLLPIAGPKGYGLSLFIDIFSGVLSGGKFGGNIGPQVKGELSKANISHFFLIVDISRFMPLEEFEERMESVISDIKGLSKMDGIEEIFMPGEIEQRKAEKYRSEGISLSESLLDDLKKMCERLNVEYDL